MARPPTASRLYQASFVSGELHPSLHGRIDLEQYQRSLALCRNAFVRVYGGAANRAGTRFIDFTPEDQETRLIPFAFSDDQQLCLEFTDHLLRFFTGGAQLVAHGTSAQMGDAIGSGYLHWSDASSGGSSIAFNPDGVTLVGNPSGGGDARASQIVAAGAQVGVEHVLKFAVVPFPVLLRIGTADSGEDLVSLRQLGQGVHTVAFTPSAANFFVQFLHQQDYTTSVGGVSFQGEFAFTGERPLASFAPWAGSDLRRLTWTQKADILTIMHPDYPVYEIRRYGTLSWSVVVKTFTPSIEAPVAAALSIEGGGIPVQSDYSYVVSYSTEGGEESFASSELRIGGTSPLTATTPVVITVAQPLPVGVRLANVYKFRGGVYGYMTALPAGSATFVDDGSITPKTDQTPPHGRNPFDDSGAYPACGDYWEQRLAFGGSNNAPDTIDMSKPGAFNNFSKSVPTQDSDAITMTPAGKLVRRIRHLLGGKVLYIFTDGAVFAARRGQNGVTPAMEGGVAVEVARGSTFVPPLQAGETTLFVSRAGRAVQALAYDQSSDGFGKGEISQLSDHLLAESPILDWAWAETPHQLLWMVRADGKMLSCAFLDQEQVNGWSQHDTAGQFESVCSVREAGEDRLYVQTRRRLGGVFRRCIEHMATRNTADQRDGMFLDCGLSLDLPLTIVNVLYASDGAVYIAAIAHGLSEEDLVDIDQTGVSQLDDRRFRVDVISVDVVALKEHYRPDTWVSNVGMDPWLEGGVLRKCHSTVAGLDHLEGLAVMALADGNVCGPFTVTSGRITLPVPGSRIHVGLSYTTDLQTLKLAEAPGGFGLARQITHVQVQLERTRGVWIGPSFAELTEMSPRVSAGYPGDPTPEEWDQPANRKSGLITLPVTSRVGVGGIICIRQSDPLPLEVLAVLPIFARSAGT